VAEVEKRLGPVDVLVNNTGGPPPTPAFGQDSALWSKYFQSMVLSVIAITDRVLPGMRDRKWGRIIRSLRAHLPAWSLLSRTWRFRMRSGCHWWGGRRLSRGRLRTTE
jgi:hypothetical protein